MFLFQFLFQWLFVFLCMSLSVNMHACASMYVFTNPSAWAGCDTRSIFEAAFNRFEFRVFLLDWLDNQG